MMALQKRVARVSTLPLLALRGLVVFPHTTVQFEVGRDKSIQALQEAVNHDQLIFLPPFSVWRFWRSRWFSRWWKRRG